MGKLKKIIIILIPVIGGFFLSSYNGITKDKNRWNKNTSVYDVLQAIGDERPKHLWGRTNDSALIQKGKEIVFEGVTTGPDGKKTKQQSKYFVCTDCHNTVKEDPDLSNPNPEARLDYAVENRIPFLQGTTLYGIVNRETWYNDDYIKKYGDLVKSSRDTLENAIQLCATVCSQGRALSDWEMEAVLGYFWSIDLKLKDLGLSDKDYKKLFAAKKDKHKNEELIKWVKSKYFLASPANFIDPPEDKSKGYPVEGDPVEGEKIYKYSCMTCHWYEGVTNFEMDTTKLVYNKLAKKLSKDDNYSIYEIVRRGTKPKPGYKPYMPHYPVDRLSNKQVESLVAFILRESNS